MNMTRSVLVTALLLACNPLSAASVLLTNVVVYDGTGGEPFRGDVRIEGERIAAVAPHLAATAGETVLDRHGLALAPGFIDMHSHGSGGLTEDLDAATIRARASRRSWSGRTGESNFPLRDFFAQLKANPPAINLASMVGHATLREQVMGKDLYRASTPQELAQMKSLLARELAAGAFGLSTGLEYESAHFGATTEEVIELSKIAAATKGFYISHVRDEASRTFDSFEEVLRIGREARLPVEITHIKMGSTSVWHQAAKRMPELFERARREGVDLKSDVYPYTYWHSTIRVIVPDRDYFNPQKVEQALVENGGAQNIRIVNYAPEAALAGKTLAEIAAHWQVTPVEAYMRIVKATGGADAYEQDVNVLGTSMSEDDVRWFIAHPEIMFCTDGALHGAHPRGAGSYPRILGHYVREERLLPLALAIHKMTGLPAAQLRLTDRGRIAPGFVADLVVFDPATVIDRSTVEKPEEPPLGIPDVMVSGEWVVRDGAVTGKRPGRVLRSAAYQP